MTQKVRTTGPTSKKQTFVDRSMPASAAKLTHNRVSMQASVRRLHIYTSYLTAEKVFNTSSISGGHVTNVAGDYAVHGPDEKQLGPFNILTSTSPDIVTSYTKEFGQACICKRCILEPRTHVLAWHAGDCAGFYR